MPTISFLRLNSLPQKQRGTDLDPFDLIRHVAFNQPALTRKQRVAKVRKTNILTKCGPQARTVLEALLLKYQDQGVTGIDAPESFGFRLSTPWGRR